MAKIGKQYVTAKPKIFDDFPKVDCNDCDEYFTNHCDGVSTGAERHCKSFKAVRGINMPRKIKTLEMGFKCVTGAIVVLAILIALLYAKTFGG